MSRVWIVDDDLSLQAAKTLVGDGHDLTVTEPSDDAFLDALSEDWDLILVDEELWEADKKLPPHAVDGASLVMTMRAWARREKRRLPSMAILTNATGVFEDEVPAVGAWRPVAASFIDHEPQMGRTLDVEWLFHKGDPELKAKVADLASAYERACEEFGEGGTSFAEVKAYLGLVDDIAWTALAEDALREARPPVTEDGANQPTPQRGPVTIIVWLLQRALAFPGLFVSDNHAAAFLGIKAEALDKAVAATHALAACRYTGPLSQLASRRWWTPALDALGAASSDDEVPIWREGLGQEDLLTVDNPVVVYDITLTEVGIVSAEDAVRVNPRGWPAECLQPWMSKESINKGPRWLKEIVDPDDRIGGGA